MRCGKRGGRLCGRLPNHLSAKTIYRSHMDNRERQECHIEDLKRAIRKLRNKEEERR